MKSKVTSHISLGSSNEKMTESVASLYTRDISGYERRDAVTRKKESFRTAGWTRCIDHSSDEILKTHVDTQRHGELLGLRPKAVVVGSVKQTRPRSR